MKQLVTVVIVLVSFGAILGATAAVTYMHFTTGVVHYAR